MAAQDPWEETAPEDGLHHLQNYKGLRCSGLNHSEGGNEKGNDNRRERGWGSASWVSTPPSSHSCSLQYIKAMATPALYIQLSLLPSDSSRSKLNYSVCHAGSQKEQQRLHHWFGGSLPTDPEVKSPSGQSFPLSSPSVLLLRETRKQAHMYNRRKPYQLCRKIHSGPPFKFWINQAPYTDKEHQQHKRQWERPIKNSWPWKKHE